MSKHIPTGRKINPVDPAQFSPPPKKSKPTYCFRARHAGGPALAVGQCPTCKQPLCTVHDVQLTWENCWRASNPHIVAGVWSSYWKVI